MADGLIGGVNMNQALKSVNGKLVKPVGPPIYGVKLVRSEAKNW